MRESEKSPFYGTSYPYAVGQIRALEATLLTPARFDRLIEADEAAALAALREWGYGAGAADGGLRALIEAQVRQTEDLLRQIAPDPALVEWFSLQADGHNLKVLLKAKMLGEAAAEDADDLLRPDGLFAVDLLKACVSVDDYEALSPLLGEKLAGVGELHDPRRVSMTVDAAIFEEMRRRAEKQPLLLRYMQVKAAYANALAEKRAERLGWDETSAIWQRLPESGAVAVPDTDDVAALERARDKALLDVFGDEKYDGFGAAPLLYYRERRMLEAQALRVLFAAKRAGQPVTREMLGVVAI